MSDGQLEVARRMAEQAREDTRAEYQAALSKALKSEARALEMEKRYRDALNRIAGPGVACLLSGEWTDEDGNPLNEYQTTEARVAHRAHCHRCIAREALKGGK